MERGGRLVRRLDDEHTFVRDYLILCLLLINVADE